MIGVGVYSYEFVTTITPSSTPEIKNAIISTTPEIKKPSINTIHTTPKAKTTKAMTITVELELSSPYDLTAEEVEKDLRMAEDMIGYVYDYVIKSIEVT